MINHNPVVTSIVTFPSQVQVSDSFVVICSAHDIDGDPLTYDWECSNFGASVKGAPPNNPYKLTNSRANIMVFYAPDTIHCVITPDTVLCVSHAAIFCDVRDGRGGLKTVTTDVLITR